MSKKRYVVELSPDERKRLEELIRKGKSPAKKQLKARILLQADEGPLGPKWNDPKISEALGTYPMMCARVRQQWAQGGMYPDGRNDGRRPDCLFQSLCGMARHDRRRS